MNNEPVAWVVQSNQDGSIFSTIAPCGYSTFDKEFAKLNEETWVKNGVAKVIPLYTHPVKQLSDEEITKIYSESKIWVPDRDVNDLIEFARAILRKAQEK